MADLPMTVSARRAYAEVLGLFAAFFGGSALFAGFAFAGRLEPQDPAGSWAVYLPATFDLLVSAGLAVVVGVLLARRRGLTIADLGLVLRRNDAGRPRWWAEVRVAAWAWVALIVGMAVMAAFSPEDVEPGPANAASLVFRTAVSINAGIMEELVVLGFLVATLRQARRPTAEIVAIAVALKVSYHLYYGVAALGLSVWAAAFVWLFWRTRSLLPLIAVHIWWDLMVSFGEHHPMLGGLGAIAALVLLVVAPISWIVEQTTRPTTPAIAAGGSPPGWHPDPWHVATWRWWDGAQWTATVAGEAQPVANT